MVKVPKNIRLAGVSLIDRGLRQYAYYVWDFRWHDPHLLLENAAAGYREYFDASRLPAVWQQFAASLQPAIDSITAVRTAARAASDLPSPLAAPQAIEAFYDKYVTQVEQMRSLALQAAKHVLDWSELLKTAAITSLTAPDITAVRDQVTGRDCTFDEFFDELGQAMQPGISLLDALAGCAEKLETDGEAVQKWAKTTDSPSKYVDAARKAGCEELETIFYKTPFHDANIYKITSALKLRERDFEYYNVKSLQEAVHKNVARLVARQAESHSLEELCNVLTLGSVFEDAAAAVRETRREATDAYVNMILQLVTADDPAAFEEFVKYYVDAAMANRFSWPGPSRWMNYIAIDGVDEVVFDTIADIHAGELRRNPELRARLRSLAETYAYFRE